MNAFNEQTCQRCGTCLEQCPFMHLPSESAKEEISKMIETRDSKVVLKGCAGCSYCNIICPTGSKPYELIREMRLLRSTERGVRSISLITEEVPHNLMSIAAEIDAEKKKQDLNRYENPSKSDTVYYLGCGIPYCFPDIAKTKLFGDLPLIGGMKYCCGGYVHSSFGKNEAKIKGLELLKKFKFVGIEKLITFCPGCDSMIRGVYPSIIDEFNIEGQTIIDYLIEKYHKGEFIIKNKITQRITFQDPCPWRNLDKKIYDSPRELLEIIGAEVVEMKHNKETSLCCGLPISASNRSLAADIAREKLAEAEDVNAEIIAHICTGCFSALSNTATERKIKSYYITELAQLAIGEQISLNIVDNTKCIQKQVINTISKNPNIISERYIIKNGKICRL
ncbi:MAG: (Fe-S)-binding protein [Candidatus Thorarchaeota archaeon]